MFAARRRRWLVLAGWAAAGAAVGAACGPSGVPQVTSGDVALGRTAIQEYGCGSCHAIPGIRGADGLVGPPLTSFGRRSYIAGALPNNQENLARWVRDPQGVEPGTAMPNLGVSREEARNIATYLLSLD